MAPKQMIAESVSHYRILEKLGAGGMGIVYKARDTRLDRVVALKVLPQDLLSDPVRKQRFQAEAKAASALNHPNIVTIYDIGSDNGTDFIAMEYVPGTTLGQLIGHKPLPVAEAIGYAVQIAEALAVAHRAGIVHRDLKPGNIMIPPPGRVKLLDFGLAKLVRGHADGQPHDFSPTETLGEITTGLTEEGFIVGTVAYMSPEQLTGGTVDARTDIFSFGVVLYEMLTGCRPFAGSSSLETAGQILNVEPKPARALVPGIPLALERIVRHCLRKNADDRLQSIADVARLLGDVREDLASGKLPEADSGMSRRRRNGLIAAAGALLLAVAAVAAWRFLQPLPGDRGPVLTRLTFDSGLSTNPAVSPDGKLMAYASDRDGRGNLDIWVRQIAGGEPLQITRDPADESEPDFSPDATKIVYRSNREGGGIYMTSALGGGEPQLIAPAGYAPRFSPDGKWISYYIGEMSSLTRRPMRSKLFVMNVSGGHTRQLEPELAAAYHAIWAPDSKHVLFCGSEVGNNAEPTDWYVISPEGGKATRTGAARVLIGLGLSDIMPYAWTGNNEIIFSATLGDSRNIWQFAISGGDWQPKGKAERLTSGTGLESEASLASVSPAKRLVFSVLSSRINLWSLPLDPSGVKPAGDLNRITDDEAAVGFPDITADGNLLIFPSNRSGSTQIWSKDLKTGKLAALTDGSANTASSVAPDGSKFAYYAEAANHSVTIGTTPPRARLRRIAAENAGYPYSWSATGAWLFYAVRNDRFGVDAFHVSSGRKHKLIDGLGYDVTFFHSSPDDRWAVASAFSDPVSRIQVAPLREGTAINEKDWFSIADDAAEHDRPMWSRDGTLVYYTSYRDGFRCIWAQRLHDVTKRPSGPPVPVFHSHSARISLRNAGQDRFKIAVAPDNLVFNMGELRGNIWMATLRR
jgi:serine/threonine protein kinase/Tol biopolymer transport system component